MTESWTWVLMSFRVLVVAAPALAAPAASYGDWKVETRPDKLRGDEFAAWTGDAAHRVAQRQSRVHQRKRHRDNSHQPLSRAKQVGIKITYSRDNT